MNISALLSSYYDLSGEQMNHINEFVARALLHVVHHHILSVTPSLVLTLCCRSNHTCNFYNEMMSTLFRQWGLAPLQIVNVEPDVPWRPVPGRRHFNVIFTDSFAAFSEIRMEYYAREYNYNEHYFIFLQARDRLLQGEMRQIFDYCWRYHLIHCSIQVQKSNGDILFYSYYPFGEQGCRDMEPQLINRYNGSMLVEPELFPRKLRNFFGCPLRCALWHAPPFLRLYDHQTEEEEQQRPYVGGGYEGRLLLALAEKMNFTIDVLPLASNLHDKALEMLQEDKADLTLGGIRQTVPRSLKATSTDNYHQTRAVFGVLASSYELSSLDILLYPYRFTIWLAILGVVAFSALLQLMVERFLRERQTGSASWQNLELIFVGMPLIKVPRSHTARLYCLMLMMYTLIIRTIYQGLLYHLIRTHQLNRWPQTIEALVQKNFTVVLTSQVQEALEEIPSVQHMKFHLLDEAASELDPLYFLGANHQLRRHVTATALDNFIHFNRLSAERVHQSGGLGEGAHYELVPEDIINLPLTMYLRKHSFLIDQINEEILWMRSVGLLAVWARWELVESYLRNEQSFQILGLLELYVIFLMVTLGLSLSLVVFLLELASRRFLHLRKLFS
ncbi:uncharacterized protein Dana_GF21243 [Drosophila ananassae]|uniref:Putative ionotropic receptor ligand binding domain-containing protein n=1 Tax=Drosophila ananassae TaxID=7217 RepID=B3MRA5_DROAN|nr:uncharacterized protein LOC6503927 [Drosophila ananassae]EDV34310.2 uncharacterized protein Dana_GF21243 [Drosophila ananassae]